MKTEEKNFQLLKNIAINDGMNLFGVADISSTDLGFGQQYKYAISIGYRLSKSILETLIDGPDKIYYFHYQRVNILLDLAALKISSYIHNEGYSAFPIPASQVINWGDINNYQERSSDSKFAISHKKIAYLAGLGWFGRNNLIVNPEYGSQVRYASIITDMPLEANIELLKMSCGECKKCITVCPAKAITETGFDIKLCSAKLREFQKTRSLGHMVCGMCLKVCSKP